MKKIILLIIVVVALCLAPAFSQTSITGGIKIPSVSGQSGKYLSNNGTKYIWSTVATPAVSTILKTTVDGTVINTNATYEITYSGLIAANTVTVGDVLELFLRATFTGSVNAKYTKVYLNTTSSLSGATVVGYYVAGSGATSFDFGRRFAVKSATNTEGLESSTSYLQAEQQQSVPLSLNNINWAVNQYLIVAFYLPGASDTGKSSYLKLIK